MIIKIDVHKKEIALNVKEKNIIQGYPKTTLVNML
jgi:hypothetical protein